jgi:hypothetical protein
MARDNRTLVEKTDDLQTQAVIEHHERVNEVNAIDAQIADLRARRNIAQAEADKAANLATGLQQLVATNGGGGVTA